MPIESKYLDSSAIVKLLLPEEADARTATEIFERSGSNVTSKLGYVEAWSALMRRHRAGELNDQRLEQAQDALELLWDQLFPLEVTEARIRRAADLVKLYPLSGADAVHLATALDARSGGPLMVGTWDRRQAEAARALGFPVQPPID